MSFHYIRIFNSFAPTAFICIVFGDDVFLESACLVSWPVRKQTHRPKKHLFSSDQLDQPLCFQGVQLILWLKGRGLKPAISGTILELDQIRLYLRYSL